MRTLFMLSTRAAKGSIMQAKSCFTTFTLMWVMLLSAFIGTAQASGYQVIYNFTGGAGYRSTPSTPFQGPSFDPVGNLVGSTAYGGPNGYGSVYRISPAGALIGEFGFPNKAVPEAGPLVDPLGNVFIASDSLREKNFTYFRKPDGETGRILIGSFNQINGPFIFNQLGDLIASSSNFNVGNVFSVSLRTRTTTILHTFPGQYTGTGTDGYYPTPGSLAMDAQGSLYGGTSGGGPLGGGTIYRLSPSGAETNFYSFPSPTGCQTPNSGLTFDGAGTLYGTSQNVESAGCIFKISPSGQFTLLHQFSAADGDIDPNGGLVFDSAGNLYGTTSSTLFKLALDGTLTVLHTFSPNEPPENLDGSLPNYGVAIDSSGHLFGTTSEGGPLGNGVLFEFSQ